MRTMTHWRLRTRTLDLGLRTLVMGVVNITPDSFSDGGSFLDSETGCGPCAPPDRMKAQTFSIWARRARGRDRMRAERTRRLSAEEEQARLLPVLEGILRARPDAVISVDTYKAATARAALKAGAEIINDVSGFTWDPAMAQVCAEFGAGVVLDAYARAARGSGARRRSLKRIR